MTDPYDSVRDRPVQVEITQEMIDAGALSLSAWLDALGLDLGPTLTEQVLVEVFLSMAKGCSQLHPNARR